MYMNILISKVPNYVEWYYRKTYADKEMYKVFSLFPSHMYNKLSYTCLYQKYTQYTTIRVPKYCDWKFFENIYHACHTKMFKFIMWIILFGNVLYPVLIFIVFHSKSLSNDMYAYLQKILYIYSDTQSLCCKDYIHHILPAIHINTSI